MQKISPLQENDYIPKFSNTDLEGNSITNKILLGQKYLIYFYPRDNTPGCTAQACGFRDHFSFFRNKNIKILGVSGDSMQSHEKFRLKFLLPFPLLLDENNVISKAFGVWGVKKFMGRVFEGIHRTSFFINEYGKTVKAYYQVKAKSRPEELVQEW
jgi:peroxiredoxin Q/BCP